MDTKQYQLSSLVWKVNVERTRFSSLFFFCLICFASQFFPIERESIPKFVYRLNDSIVLFDTFHIYSLVFIAVDSELALDFVGSGLNRLFAFIAHRLLFDQTRIYF